jgi:acyl-CoA synthetase (AMP-forming)/AMP-acid ligase II
MSDDRGLVPLPGTEVQIIDEAGVGGREDETYGARPVAWLVCFEDQAPTAEELEAFCRARLAAYKCPVDYRFVEALPRTATG